MSYVRCDKLTGSGDSLVRCPLRELHQGDCATFVKHDTDKGSRPGLITVEFRRALRCGPLPSSGNLLSAAEALEDYELYGHINYIAQAAKCLCLYGSASDFLPGMARVLAFGAKKYSDDNWKHIPYEQRYRYVDAFYRHLWAMDGGEVRDSETDELHLHHAACCLMMLHGAELIHAGGMKGPDNAEG